MESNFDPPKHLIDALNAGKTVVIPTDTLYGICCRALDQSAVAQLIKIRSRDKTKKFITLISDLQQLEIFNINVTARQKKILQDYWPGPNTIIFDATEKEFGYLHGDCGGQAFRLPDSQFLQQLIAQTGPLIAPSANPTGLPTAQSITKARAYFGDQVGFYQNGGKLDGRPSQLYRLHNNTITPITRS